ncbi:exosortase A [Undibacterium terreum]|uniref:Exosortase A n=1 Tax=Undibacterium terreum TaxID=1224302 RepID=A0A916XQK5_9BURK|nr:exosortase A [Undibacterium terreum]GGC97153.1 exosortase A [Undibacterium terreum]
MTTSTPANPPSNFIKGLIITGVLLIPFLFYLATAESIVSVWNSSETFAHGYIIAPISLVLIWLRRKSLMQMTVQPYWPALLALLACGLAWLLADLGEVQVIKQYSFVAMFPLAVVVLLGRRVSWAMAFPLFFVLLAVPFGEVFIAPLIDFTADFTILALQATGIPVLRDGSSFSIPSGNWSVVEACSGVRYLISSLTLGCLYAYLTYRSLKRQLAFVALSIVVPIIANGMRAYMIVMIGHLSGMQLAVGVDHIIYGWLFFGLVMFIMFWIGSFWRENKDDTVSEAERNQARLDNPPVSTGKVLVAAVAVVICIGIWPAYASYIKRISFNPAPAQLAGLHIDWQESASFTTWRPVFLPASAELDKAYQHNGERVNLLLKYYRNQTRDTALISSVNIMVPDHDDNWTKTNFSVRQESVANRQIVIRETQLKGPSGPMVVWHWYWLANRYTANNYVGKLLQTKEKVLMNGDDGASIIVYAPFNENPEEARTALRDFLNANLDAVQATLSANKK